MTRNSTRSAATAGITGAFQTSYTRHPGPHEGTAALLGEAVCGALDDAGLRLEDVDGLGISSFSLAPDHAIDLAWRLGLSLRWVMEDPHGGASALNLLQHAVRAVEAGDASVVVLVAGDNLRSPGAFESLTDNYNVATRTSLAPLDFGGPNALFAMVTKQHMARTGLTETDYAQVPLAQRRWATANPKAVYRSPLTMEEYLAARVVTDPLRTFDCVPIVAGADAVVVRADSGAGSARVTAIAAAHNPDHQRGDGTWTGHRDLAADLWDRVGLGPDDIDVIGVYDDYPVMVVEQLHDLGFAPDGDLARLLHTRIAKGWAVNTSGGQLSAGQAGAAGGMHLLVEAATQLLGRAGRRQVDSARTALVTGYGMTLYRYGACANAAVLEAS